MNHAPQIPAMEQTHVFLTTGETRNTCPRGLCDYPALGERTGGESNEGLCQ